MKLPFYPPDAPVMLGFGKNHMGQKTQEPPESEGPSIRKWTVLYIPFPFGDANVWRIHQTQNIKDPPSGMSANMSLPKTEFLCLVCDSPLYRGCYSFASSASGP